MSALLEPLRFRCGAVAKNRIALAALTNLQSGADGVMSEAERRWLVRRIEGDFGLITTCAAYVRDDGRTWPGACGVSNDAQARALSPLAAAATARGALSLVQLFHGGLRAQRSVSGLQPIGPSERPELGVRAVRTDELPELVEAFANAARRSHQAGCDGVELHGAHGYLLGQFLSREENQRNDAYGGSLAARARLLRETLRAVRQRLPASFVVGVRLSPEDGGQARGLDLDETLQLCRWLADDGADFVHASLWDVTRACRKYPALHPLPLLRAALPSDVALLCAGSIWQPALAERCLQRGADAVALGRAAILNPDWPQRCVREQTPVTLPPISEDELLARALSPAFVRYLARGWPALVRS